MTLPTPAATRKGILLMLLAIVLFTSVWTFNQAVARIDVSVASTIRSLNFVVTIALAMLLSQEKLTPRDWIAVAFATAARISSRLQTSAASTNTAPPSASSRCTA